MKRITAILLAVLVFCLCFSGCKDSDPTIDDNKTTTSQLDGRLLEQYDTIVKTGKYMYTMTVTDSTGKSTPITVIVYGSAKRMVSFTDSANELSVAILMKDGKYYILLPDSKVYCEATTETLKQYAESINTSSILLSFTKYTYQSAGTQAIGDTTYKYEDYYYPDNQKTVRFFFTDDGTIKYRGVKSSDGTVTPTSFEIYGNVTEDSVSISADYTDGGTELENQLVSSIATAS